MKKIGSVAEFGRQRNEELMAAFHAAMRDPGLRSLDDMFKAAAKAPASRFWVSERRATEVVSAMMRGVPLERMTPKRRDMYKELYRRALLYIKEKPGCSLYDAVFAAVNSPAPEFYLTPKSARVILYRFRRSAARV